MVRLSVVLFLCFALMQNGVAQSDSLHPINYKQRKLLLAGVSGVLTVGSLIYLDQAWYQQYNTGRFHFFNDNDEWLQMDKMGHTYTTYQVGRLMMGAFNNAGFSRQQELFIGGTTGLAYMTVIEVLDGFSGGWGFSWGDEVADVLGASIAISQQTFWKEQRIQLKFSYSKSGLANYNPDLLGKNAYTQILKDYNGQTYWLSLNPSTFMSKSTRFPKWLNVAVGYGAYGMLGAVTNNIVVEDPNGDVLQFNRERRFYLSLDVDLTRIRVRSPFLKKLFSIVSLVKIPAPALQFSCKGVKGYYLYF